MTHPHEDQLLLLAYGELPEADAREMEAHLAACASCRAQLERLERARIALDVALRPRRRVPRWVAVALAAAAVLVVVVWPHARPPSVTSVTPAVSLTLPRYMAPGLVTIDSLLTRLEQEKPYAIP